MNSISIAAALSWASDRLKPRDEARLDAELLLANILSKSRTWLKTWPEQLLSEQQFSDYQSLIERRQQGEPVAYILGAQEFWSLEFKVTPDTLIPRPETEVLVEQALQRIQSEQEVSIADLGTGSGAIALAIAHERPKARVWAVDASLAALAVAKDNAQRLQISNVQFVQGDWLADWQQGTLDMVVSNPPYVAAGDPHLEELRFEPQSALVAEQDGLADIEQISRQAAQILAIGGFLLFEHGYNQGAAVRRLLAKYGFSKIETVTDYAGNDRVTLGQKAD